MDIRQWAANLDYLRITGRSVDADMDSLRALCIRVAGATAGGSVADPVPARRLGYAGWQLERTFWGESQQGYMVEASSVTAHHLAVALAQSGFVPTSIPRIDVAVTVWLGGPDDGVARRLAPGAVAAAESDARMAKPRLILGFGRGDTLYAGSRGGAASEFIRVYDKYRQSRGDPRWLDAWRFELELTNRRALPAWQTLAPQFDEIACYAVVSAACMRRGVVPPDITGIDPLHILAIPRPPTTDESRLEWLVDSVRPAIDRLRAAGYHERYIATLLGLENLNEG
jgi:hypothetical protein